ncbi:hypothetical protein [Sphingomonas psychrotolerans]|uniref:Uncharacterized protein n=1 Tax=Sphingomonas psychrotolerans TaxID=1327635 RepID=A0A2K8MK86_9SPHN|nr:hypothetical protein [Sphingomonas psychrotolerans]ATY34283.1 hypothetical protein CVN68_21895 [Sphingomonas psychrotolerans]
MTGRSLGDFARYVAAGAAGLGLAGLAIVTSMGFARADQQRDELPGWGPARPLGEAVYAEQTLLVRGIGVAGSTNVDPAILNEAKRTAIRSLQGAPLLVRALRTLAMATALSGDYSRSEDLIVLAGRASRRDRGTEAWLIERAYRLNRPQEAALHFDSLLRVTRGARDAAFKTTVPMMSRPPLFEAVSRRMVLRPEWRTPFLYEVGTTADPNVAIAALRRQAALGASPTDEELRPFFVRSANLPDVPRWRAAWLDFLPASAPKRTLVYDGGFGGAPGVVPFNWELTEEPNVNVVRIPRDDSKGNAVRAELYTTGAALAARQLLALKPGRYRFRAASSMEVGNSQGVAWLVRCNGQAGTELMRSGIQAGKAFQWQAQRSTFEVPATNCESQWLLLAIDANGESSQRAFWVDDVQIAAER